MRILYVHGWYIKQPMHLLFIWCGTKWFWGGTIHNSGHFRGEGPKTLVPFKGPKKSWFLGPSPLKCPSLWIVPPQNHFVPHHINNRYINSYFVDVKTMRPILLLYPSDSGCCRHLSKYCMLWFASNLALNLRLFLGPAGGGGGWGGGGPGEKPQISGGFCQNRRWVL